MSQPLTDTQNTAPETNLSPGYTAYEIYRLPIQQQIASRSHRVILVHLAATLALGRGAAPRAAHIQDPFNLSPFLRSVAPRQGCPAQRCSSRGRWFGTLHALVITVLVLPPTELITWCPSHTAVPYRCTVYPCSAVYAMRCRQPPRWRNTGYECEGL
jgi:hypothetical protein